MVQVEMLLFFFFFFCYKGLLEDSTPVEFAPPVACRWVVLMATVLGKGFLTWTGFIMKIWKCHSFHIAKPKDYMCTWKRVQFLTQTFGILGSFYALSPIIFVWVKQSIWSNRYIPADCIILPRIAVLEGSSLLTTGQRDKSWTEAYYWLKG